MNIRLVFTAFTFISKHLNFMFFKVYTCSKYTLETRRKVKRLKTELLYNASHSITLV